jgi:hypothetical protein
MENKFKVINYIYYSLIKFVKITYYTVHTTYINSEMDELAFGDCASADEGDEDKFSQSAAGDLLPSHVVDRLPPGVSPNNLPERVSNFSSVKKSNFCPVINYNL